MTSGAYPYATNSESSRGYGVLDEESDKLSQPLISSDDGYYTYSSDGDPLHGNGDSGDDEMERGLSYYHSSSSSAASTHETDQLLRRKYDEIPLKPSSTEMLRSIVTKVLWPMTAMGSQTAKVYMPHKTTSSSTHGTAPSSPYTTEVDNSNALHTVTTLQALTKSRRRASTESVDDLHDRALQRIALATLCASAWLILTVYRHSA